MDNPKITQCTQKSTSVSCRKRYVRIRPHDNTKGNHHAGKITMFMVRQDHIKKKNQHGIGDCAGS